MTWARMTVLLLWLLAAVAATVIATTVPVVSVLPALALVFAGLILLAFVGQFTVHPLDGLVGRLAAGVAGAILILALAGGLALLLR